MHVTDYVAIPPEQILHAYAIPCMIVCKHPL